MELIKNVAELNKSIDAWGKRGKKWLTDGHHLAMSALGILAEHGDIMPLNRLYLAMPKGTKTGAMGEWILAFASVIPNDSAESAKSKPFVFSKDKKCDLTGGAKTPWYTFQPEKEVTELFDVQAATLAAIQSIIKKAAAAQSVNHGELLERLTSLAEELSVAGVDDEAEPVDTLANPQA